MSTPNNEIPETDAKKVESSTLLYQEQPDSSVSQPSENSGAPSKKSGVGFCAISSVVAMILLCGVGFLLNLFLGLLFTACIIPAVIVLATILCCMGPKVRSELTFEMFWSGIVSTIIALVNEIGVSYLIITFALNVGLVWTGKTSDGKTVYLTSLPWKIINSFLNAFVIAALLEELVKLLLIYRIRNRKGMNSPEACVMYTIAGALGIVFLVCLICKGFATLENIEYVLNSASLNVFHGFLTAFLRSILSIPLHLTCAALIGIAFAKKKFLNYSTGNYYFGIGLAIMVHGVYDFILFIVRDFSDELGAYIVAAGIDALFTFSVLLYTIWIYRSMCREWEETNRQNDDGVVESEQSNVQ